MRSEKIRTKRSVKIKILIVVTLVGLVMTIYCNREMSKAKASVSWPSVKGKMISSEMISPSFRLGGRGTLRG